MYRSPRTEALSGTEPLRRAARRWDVAAWLGALLTAGWLALLAA